MFCSAMKTLLGYFGERNGKNTLKPISKAMRSLIWPGNKAIPSSHTTYSINEWLYRSIKKKQVMI